uniref:Uncharacterized protein n=1 Tax=Haemonchus contortus TaxID=6289 RepID=W6NB01_HAECO
MRKAHIRVTSKLRGSCNTAASLIYVSRITVKLFPETLEVLTTSQSVAPSERHVSIECDLQDGSCSPVRRSGPREGCGTICKQTDSECRRVTQSSVQSELFAAYESVKSTAVGTENGGIHGSTALDSSESYPTRS